jgi:hypothetical protein
MSIQGTGAADIAGSLRLGGISEYVGDLGYHNFSCYKRTQAVTYTTTTTTSTITTTTTLKTVVTYVAQQLTFAALTNFTSVTALANSYKNAMVQATGTSHNDVAQVEVQGITVQVSYGSFPNSITETQAAQAIALSMGVDPSAVTVTFAVNRRLASAEARRLTKTAHADIRVNSTSSSSGGMDMVGLANQVYAKSTNTADLGAKLAQVTGTNVSAPTVATAPSVKVEVRAQVVTKSNQGGAALQTVMASSSNTMASTLGATQVAVTSVVLGTSSTTTTTQKSTTTTSGNNSVTFSIPSDVTSGQVRDGTTSLATLVTVSSLIPLVFSTSLQ